MKIGEVFAYRRPYTDLSSERGGLQNYFHVTFKEGNNLPLLDSGINNIAGVPLPDGSKRTPAILISSSPHKTGSAETPWKDYFDSDNGHIRYYGDNKSSSTEPERSKGNRVLLNSFRLHQSPKQEERKHAPPILFFERVSYKGRVKGNVKFQGFGIIERVERVTQYNLKSGDYFSNYVFDFAVFRMDKENEIFNWDWINNRREEKNHDPLKDAPESWKSWVKDGNNSLEKHRRKISTLLTVKAGSQKPNQGSREEQALKTIYDHYEGKKHVFEGLASVVAKRIMSSDKKSNSYKSGWITPSSSDGGADFVGRLDIGTGFATTKLVVLGQAKCEKLDTPTNGQHIARTVARLRRGWIGVYVTTSYFSESVQREIIDDAYPIVLVHGLRLAKEILELMNEEGITDIKLLLRRIDSTYKENILPRKPEEILFV